METPESKKNEDIAAHFNEEQEWNKEKDFRVFILPGRYGSNEPMELHVNWNSLPEIANCQSIKFVGKTKSGETFETVVKYEDLMSLMFLLGDKYAQRSMIQPKVFKKIVREMHVPVTLTKDRHRGERIVIKVDVPIELMEEAARHPYSKMQDVRKFIK